MAVWLVLGNSQCSSVFNADNGKWEYARHTLQVILGLVCLIPVLAFADLPLTVEGMLSAQNRWRAELGINYANVEQRGVSTGQSVAVQVSAAQFVSVPTQVGSSRLNSDTIVLSPGLRYGYSANTELYGRSSWLSDSARIQGLGGTGTQNSKRFDSLWLGINHQFIEEGKSPALLGFVEIAALEKNLLPGTGDSQNFSGRSALIGATSYRVIDPIVLSLTGAYRINAARDIKDQSYKPGNSFVLSSTVSFSVNTDITLSAGMLWRNAHADVLNGQDQSLLRTSTDMNLGLAWLWDEHTTLSINSKSNQSGSGGSDIGMTWTYKLGELPKRKRPGKAVSP